VRYLGRSGSSAQVPISQSPTPWPSGSEPPHELSQDSTQREFEFRYDFLGRVAERIGADGLTMRYTYTAEDELATIEVGRYENGTFVPGHGLRDIAADTIGFVEYITTWDRGSFGEPLRTLDIKARVKRPASSGASERVISHVRQSFDAQGRLIREQQAIGGEVNANTPAIDYIRSPERANPGNQGLASQNLTEMIYPRIGDYDRRRVVLSYGTVGSIDEELGRVTAIGTRLTPTGTLLPLSSYTFGGSDRRVQSVIGPVNHGVVRSLHVGPLGVSVPGQVGYLGVDGFGRERVASYRRVSSNPAIPGEELVRMEYQFDRHNRITWQHLSFGNASAPGERPWHRGYRYDKLGRLVEAAVGNVSRGAREIGDGLNPSWTLGSQLTRHDRWFLDAADNWSLADPMWPGGGGAMSAMPGGRVVTTWDQHSPPSGIMAAFRQSHLWSGDLALLRVGLDGTVDPPGGGPEVSVSEAVKLDGLGRVVCDGRQWYLYDAWGRLTQVNKARRVVSPVPGAYGWEKGDLIRHFTYDGLGRLIRVQRRAVGLESNPTIKLVSSERFYYDGVRRVTEVISAPVMSKESGGGTVEAPDVIEAESGDAPDEKTANASFEGWQLQSNQIEIALEYVWDVEGPTDTLLAFLGGTNLASAYGEGSSQRQEVWFPIQDQTGDPVAVLSGPMGSIVNGQPMQPMRLSWRGVLCNTGGVIFADDRDWTMPALRIGHKGLHVERLDGTPYIFNLQYWPERLQASSGRTSAHGSMLQDPDGHVDLLMLMRNRVMVASHGRFLQPDPNATGLPVMGDLSFGGSALSPPRPEVDLTTWTTDGLTALAYCGGDSVNRGDPTGLFAGFMAPTSMFDLYTDHMSNTLDWGSQTQQFASNLWSNYAIGMSDDLDWAFDMDAPDDAYSRSAWASRYMQGRPGRAVGSSQQVFDNQLAMGGIVRHAARPGFVLHHLFTNKNWKAGPQWSRVFDAMFKGIGMSLNSRLNTMELVKEVHSRGRHGQKYHEFMHGQLKMFVQKVKEQPLDQRTIELRFKQFVMDLGDRIRQEIAKDRDFLYK
jgi:hypothetical protein